MVYTPFSWMDKVWITIDKEGTTGINVASQTADVDWGGGDSGVDVLNTNAGQTPKLNRQEPFEISFSDVIPVNLQWKAWKEGNTVLTPALVTSGTSRSRFRLSFLWHNTTGITAATSGVASGSMARRCIVKDCWFTSNEENWADQVLKGTAKFTVPALDETGSGNVRWEYCDTTTTPTSLSALAVYTGGHFV